MTPKNIMQLYFVVIDMRVLSSSDSKMIIIKIVQWDGVGNI